ncbi:MAG TPA: hypothetical protein VMM92_04580, partial [Thermoanaerobaculia bacterium]|nr:hypothetical protein [Thermoanaerobaculia bacterium]
MQARGGAERPDAPVPRAQTAGDRRGRGAEDREVGCCYTGGTFRRSAMSRKTYHASWGEVTYEVER